MKAKRKRPSLETATSTRQKQAVLYARVSSKEQEKGGYSVPAQLKLLRGYSDTENFKIAREFVDVETAKETGRKGFGEMIAFLKKTPSCRIVLVEKTDRLYRNLKDWVTLDELDLEIHFVKENVVLSKDSRSSEKFVHGIKVLMAKNYIDNLSEETRKGMVEKAEQGIWPSVAAIGYRNVAGANGKKTIEPDPETAGVISGLFTWYATGKYSLHELVKMARKAGLTQVRSKKPLGRAHIHQILRNRVYTGEFMWKGKVYSGNYEPLTSKELWEQVQEILDRKSKTKQRRAARDFAFSRLISCGHCGCALVGQETKGKYVYYHCTGYKGKCPERLVRQEVLEACFTELLKAIRLDREVVVWVGEALRQSHVDEKKFHEEAIARLEAEYKTFQNRLDQMYLDKLDGRIDAQFFDRKAAEWRAEQERVRRAIREHEGANENYLESGVRLLKLASRAVKLFEKQKPSEKRRLLNFVLSNCTWKDGQLHATFRQPFDMLAVTTTVHHQKKAAGATSSDLRPIWLPALDSNFQQDG